MSFSKIIAGVFGIIFIGILYFIIFYALRIMAKDVKNGEKKKRQIGQKHHGIEVIANGENDNLKVGTIIPIKTYMSIGRTEDNTIVLTDKYVSSRHAKIIVKNNTLILEDLGSTNGTYLNGQRIQNKVKLFTRDELRIGTAVFKVLT